MCFFNEVAFRKPALTVHMPLRPPGAASHALSPPGPPGGIPKGKMTEGMPPPAGFPRGSSTLGDPKMTARSETVLTTWTLSVSLLLTKTLPALYQTN